MRILTSIFFLFFSFSLTAQIQFQHIYGDPWAGQNYCTQKTFDGGYIMVGYISGIGAGGYDIYLVKTDSLGIIEWDKTYGSTDEEIGYYVEQTADSGFIISGTHGTSPSKGNMILKTDASGNLIWASKFQSPFFVQHNKIIQTPDGGYVTNTPELCKIDSSGNLVWSNTYYNNMGVADLAVTSDGGIICFISVAPSPILIRLSAAGNVLWSKTYDFGSNVAGMRIRETSDGGLALFGYYYPLSSQNLKFLVRFDSSGNSLWARTYDANGWIWFSNFIETDDQGYAISGNLHLSNEYNSFLVKTDSSGIPEWSKEYGIQGCSEAFFSLAQNNDNGFILGGTRCGNPYLLQLIRTDSLGNSGCNEATNSVTDAVLSVYDTTFATNLTNANLLLTPLTLNTGSGGSTGILCNNVVSVNEILPDAIEIFPNPSTDYIHIKMGEIQQATIQISDLRGNLIETLEIKNESEVKLNLQKNKPGMYFIRIATANIISNKKFIIQ